MNRARAVVLISFLALWVIAPLARATQILYRSPQQLGEQSELVVHGRVIHVESYWNDKRTKIFTRTRVSVEQTYKGYEQPTIDIVQLGGVVDNVRVTVSGALQWLPGEEVLLFVEPYRDGTYQVSGFSQGKLNVLRDPDTGEAFVERPALEGVEVLGAPPKESLIKGSQINKVPLDVFINQVLYGKRDKGGSR